MALCGHIPVATRWAGGFLLLLLGALILDQRHWWDLRDDYLFGYLVPLFVGWVLFERWPMIAGVFSGKTAQGAVSPEVRTWEARQITLRSEGEPPRWLKGLFGFGFGTAAIFGFFAILMAALYRTMEGPNLVTTQLLALAMIGLGLSAVYFFSDERADGSVVPWRERMALVGLFIFPVCIWLLSAPMFNFLEKAISTALLGQVAAVVFFVFDVLGFVIVREGNILILPAGEVGVEDACSGIRSLMACLFAGSFLAAVCLPLGLKHVWKKVLMVGFAMFFAFVMNIFRSIFLTGWAYRYGSEAIGDQFVIFGMEIGTVHDVTGFAVIAPVVLALLALLPVFTFSWEREIPDDEAAPEPAPSDAN